MAYIVSTTQTAAQATGTTYAVNAEIQAKLIERGLIEAAAVAEAEEEEEAVIRLLMEL